MLAAERRYAADLRVQEITRALRALSSAYVERRERNARQQVHGALAPPGKRAALAPYYAPPHFIAVTDVVRTLGAVESPSHSIADLGCGTGAAGAAWALASKSMPALTAIDRHPWAVTEARWTFAQLGLNGQARLGDVGRLRGVRAGEDVIAAYTLNELSDTARGRTVQQLCVHARLGARVLIVEPLARTVSPWWQSTAEQMAALGGRADEWKLTVEVPPIVALLGKAA